MKHLIPADQHNVLATKHEAPYNEYMDKVSYHKAALQDYEDHSQYYGRNGTDFEGHTRANIKYYEELAAKANKQMVYHKHMSTVLSRQK